jgi:hypothetical protein
MRVLHANWPPVHRFFHQMKIADSGCWEWTGSKRRGYGRFRVKGKTIPAHRFAWAYFNFRDFPEGLEPDHLCKNRGCVNPDHIQPVTHLENIQRAETCISTLNAAKTHCRYGHPLSGQNLYKPGRGGRVCRICRKATDHRKYVRRLERSK